MLIHFVGIPSVEQCQTSCSVWAGCEYFLYDKMTGDCTFVDAAGRTCVSLHGPPEPPINRCSGTTTTSTPLSSTSASMTSTTSTTTSPVPPPETTLKLLVVGGYTDDGCTDDVEMIDPLVGGSNCHDPPDYPKQVNHLTGTMLNSKDSIFCGGYGKCKYYKWNTLLQFV